METIKPIDPLLAAALDPHAFEPKTWYESSFGVNDNAQTVLIGPYDEDELIQEAERRGAVKALREQKAYILKMSVKAIKQYGGPEDRTDSWKISVGFNQAMAALDAALSALRAHEYEENEIQTPPIDEPESFGFTEEDWH